VEIFMQAAATRLYAMTGFLIVIGTFFLPKVIAYLRFGAIAAGIIIPGSVWNPYRIGHDHCEDVVKEGQL
jgi:hypothetical protein